MLNTLRVIHFSTTDFSGAGGGSLAAFRIHSSLRQLGCESKMIVSNRNSYDQDVIQINSNNIRYLINQGWLRFNLILLRHLFGKNSEMFHPDVFACPCRDWIQHLKGAQIINLHWVANFVSSKQIKQIAQNTGAPIVWTLMDLAPLTGGCHYFDSCLGYTQRCGNCPQIRNGFRYDISRLSWQRKAKKLRDLSITIVAPSQWVANRVKKSSLFGRSRIVKIPLGVDSRIFRPIDLSIAREILGLPKDKRLIFFGATSLTSKRKGFNYLLEALSYLPDFLRGSSTLSKEEVELIVAGKGCIEGLNKLPFKSHHLGLLRGERELALAYQAADIFVCPSIEDAGPMMVNEALMCGVPVVAFDSGVAHDLVENMKTGYLATVKDSFDLAKGITAILDNKHRLLDIRKACRDVAMRECSLNVQAKRYMILYRSLINNH